MDTEQLIEDLKIRIKQIDEELKSIRRRLYIGVPKEQISGIQYNILILSGKQKGFEETIKHIQGLSVWNLKENLQ
jgi:hypothetical protein